MGSRAKVWLPRQTMSVGSDRSHWRREVVLLVFSLGFGSLGVGTIVNPALLHASPPKEKLSKEEKRRQKAIQKEMESPYKKWLDEEVPYIITAEERASFKKLSTDDEREQFIEAFWERRSPNPGSPENEFKEEYYRRIAYANEHYASGIPGWKTDRGRIYIMYGPADEIDSHPSGGTYERPPEEGGGETSTYPFEQWRYRYIDGIGTNIILEFVDPIMTQVANRDLQFQNKDGVMHGVLDIFAQITTPSGRYVNTIEESVVLDVPEHDFQTYVTHRSVYQKAVPLRPGLYKLSVVVKDDLNGQMGSMEQGIRVPRFGDDKLSSSSLIL